MSVNDIVVRARAISIYLCPVGFHRYASEYLRAAEGFKRPETYSPVPYFLYCRSIELALKAFLLARGESMKVLRYDVRHDLQAALEKADHHGLSDVVVIPHLDREELRKANCYYPPRQGKAFEYFGVKTALPRSPDLPSLEVLSKLAATLVAGLEGVCIEAAHLE